MTIPEMSRSRNLASGDGGNGGKWQRISLNGGVVSSGMGGNYACRPANKPTNLPASLSNYSHFARIFVLRRLPLHQQTCFDQFLHNVAMFHPLMTIGLCISQASCQKEKLHDDGRRQWVWSQNCGGRREIHRLYTLLRLRVNSSRYRVSKLADRLA